MQPSLLSTTIVKAIAMDNCVPIDSFVNCLAKQLHTTDGLAIRNAESAYNDIFGVAILFQNQEQFSFLVKNIKGRFFLIFSENQKYELIWPKLVLFGNFSSKIDLCPKISSFSDYE